MIKLVFVVFVALAAVPAVVTAGEPLQCKEVLKGDQRACQQQVKERCTSKDYWERRACEAEIVMAADSCRNHAYEAACKQARTTQKACTYLFGNGLTLAQLFSDQFVEAYNNVHAASKQFADFDKEWAACYEAPGECSQSQAEACRKAPEYYRTKFRRAVDEVLGTKNREMVATDSAVLVAVNAKLRPELRYKDTELKATLEKNEKAIADAAKEEQHKRAADEAAVRAVYKKAGIKGKRLELFTSQGMPEEGRFKAVGCGRFVDTLKEMKAAKKLFVWLDGDGGAVTIRKYTFHGDNYTADEKSFRDSAAAYRYCK